MKISEFYKTMYVDASSYDNLRKIASVADGLKNSGRKVINTVVDKNIKNEVKVSRLKSTVAEHTEYLHGEDNLVDVIVNMARRYVGANNLPLLKDEGNFGKRFVNESSADRYISTLGEKYLDYIFPKDDNAILVKQEFEGEQIEPRFYVPIIPLIFVNGSPSAISTGFFQNILPRKINDVIKMVEKYIETGVVKVPKPGWEGFKGTIKQREEKRKWAVYGKFERKNTTTIEITEVPVGIELKDYLLALDSLVENKIISSYTDQSENEKFHFTVRVSRKFTAMDDEEIYEALHLKSTNKKFVENYTVMGENNRIEVFETPEEVFLAYAKIREKFYSLRKEHLISSTIDDLKKLASRYLFVKNIVDGNIVVNGKKKDEILKQIKEIPKIEPDTEGSFEFLLRMPIYSLTKEKMEELMQQIKDKKFQLDEYKATEEKDFWKNDLSLLKSHLK